MGAILLSMEQSVRLGYTSSTATDKPQQWQHVNAPNIEPAKVAHIQLNPNTKSSEPTSKISKPANNKPADDSKLMRFLRNIQKDNPNLLVMSLYSSEFNQPFIDRTPVTAPVKLPMSLRKLFMKDFVTSDPTALQDHCSEMVSFIKETTAEQIKYLEECTRSQALTPIWHEQRAGRITASVVKDVMRNNLTTSTILKITRYNCKQINAPALLWGREHEKTALLDYQSVLLGNNPSCSTSLQPTTLHKSAMIIPTGLFLSKERPYVGASPDAMMLCECCKSFTLVEVKCPYTLRDFGISPSPRKEAFCLTQTGPSMFELIQTHPYYAQVQLQLYTANCSACDFVVWTPKDMVITRIERNEPFIENMVLQCDSKFQHDILPELVTRSLEHAKYPDPSAYVEDKRECVCVPMLPMDRPMVKCTICEKSFHVECLGKKRRPNIKTWMCQLCSK